MRPIAKVALYAQMNEFTLGIYHFKGTRFPLFRLSPGRQIGKTKGMRFILNFSFKSEIGEWETNERKKTKNVFFQACYAKKPSAFQRSRAKFILLQSYRCRFAFFVANRQGNNRRVKRTRLTFSISSITLVKYVFLSSRHSNRKYMLNVELKLLQRDNYEGKVTIIITIIVVLLCYYYFINITF